MARVNVKKPVARVYTHEGAVAQKVGPLKELRRTVMTCLLWEDTHYESGSSIAKRLADLVKQNRPEDVAAIAIEARDKMYLRHVPLFLVRELARVPGNGKLVENTLVQVIQRADELAEFVAIYWKDKRQPLSAGVKRGLRRAFTKFNAYSLGKYNQDSAVKLRDVMFLVNPKPKDEEQARVFKALADKTLEAPDTWEVQLSAGKDKRETFERLLREDKLGGLATLRNLRNMVQAGVDMSLVKARLAGKFEKVLPFRFVAAAQFAPKLEDEIEGAMLRSLEGMPKLTGRTCFVIDVSGSMSSALGGMSEMSRVTVAGALAILLREVCEDVTVYATAGSDMAGTHKTKELPARRGFALSDALTSAAAELGGGGIFLVQCMDYINQHEKSPEYDRVIVLTDEQDCDRVRKPEGARKLGTFNYVVNVAAYQHGISYRNGWEHVDGWSERIVDYIRAVEAEPPQQ